MRVSEMPQPVSLVNQPVDDPEAEISFEDAVGPQEIDFNEAAGLDPSSGLDRRPTVNLNDVQRAFELDPTLFPKGPDDSFFAHVGKTLYQSLGRVAQNPGQAAIEGGEALASGALGMAQAAVAGVEGLLTMGGAAMTGRLGFDKLLNLGT